MFRYCKYKHNNYINKLFYTFFFKKFSHLYYNNIDSLCKCWPVGGASSTAGGWRSRHRCGAYCWPTWCRVQSLDGVRLQAFRRGASVAGVPGYPQRLERVRRRQCARVRPDVQSLGRVQRCGHLQSVSQIDTICQDVCRQMCRDSHRHLQGCVQMCRAKCVEICRRVQASIFVKFPICNIFADVCKCFAYGVCSHIEHFGVFLAAFRAFLWRFAYLNDKKCTNRPTNRLFVSVCPMTFVPK